MVMVAIINSRYGHNASWSRFREKFSRERKGVAQEWH
jgi:hypothetical protein